MMNTSTTVREHAKAFAALREASSKKERDLSNKMRDLKEEMIKYKKLVEKKDKLVVRLRKELVATKEQQSQWQERTEHALQAAADELHLSSTTIASMTSDHKAAVDQLTKEKHLAEEKKRNAINKAKRSIHTKQEMEEELEAVKKKLASVARRTIRSDEEKRERQRVALQHQQEIEEMSNNAKVLLESRDDALAQLSTLQATAAADAQALEEFKKRNQELTTAIATRDEQQAELERTLSKLDDEKKTAQDALLKKTDESNTQAHEIQKLHLKIATLQKECNRLNESLMTSVSDRATLREQMSESSKRISELEQQVSSNCRVLPETNASSLQENDNHGSSQKNSALTSEESKSINTSRIEKDEPPNPQGSSKTSDRHPTREHELLSTKTTSLIGKPKQKPNSSSNKAQIKTKQRQHSTHKSGIPQGLKSRRVQKSSNNNATMGAQSELTKKRAKSAGTTTTSTAQIHSTQQLVEEERAKSTEAGLRKQAIKAKRCSTSGETPQTPSRSQSIDGSSEVVPSAHVDHLQNPEESSTTNPSSKPATTENKQQLHAKAVAARLARFTNPPNSEAPSLTCNEDSNASGKDNHKEVKEVPGKAKNYDPAAHDKQTSKAVNAPDDRALNENSDLNNVKDRVETDEMKSKNTSKVRNAIKLASKVKPKDSQAKDKSTSTVKQSNRKSEENRKLKAKQISANQQTKPAKRLSLVERTQRMALANTAQSVRDEKLTNRSSHSRASATSNPRRTQTPQRTAKSVTSHVARKLKSSLKENFGLPPKPSKLEIGGDESDFIDMQHKLDEEMDFMHVGKTRPPQQTNVKNVLRSSNGMKNGDVECSSVEGDIASLLYPVNQSGHAVPTSMPIDLFSPTRSPTNTSLVSK